MNFNKNKIVNALLCGNNLKFPMSNTHYITGKGIFVFSNMACVENTLTCITNNLKCTCGNIRKNVANR